MKPSEFEENLHNSLYGSKKFRQLKGLLGKIPRDDKKKTAAETQPLWRQIQKEISENRGVLPFVVVNFIALLVITYVPAISMVLVGTQR